MTLRSLEIFVTVCECGGVTAASEKLYLAQPAVSLAIKELENSCDTKLFDRISNRLYMTEDGKELYSYASHIIALTKEAKDKVTGHNKPRTIRVGASITVGIHYMPEIAQKLRETYPQYVMKVTINSSSEIEKMILLNQLDFAVIEGAIKSKYILSEPICDDVLVPVFGASHPFCGMDLIDADYFFSQVFVLREPSSGSRAQFDNVASAFGRSVEVVWESTSTSALINAVIRGIGISVLPYLLVKRELKEGRLFSKPVEGVSFQRQFNLIIHKNKHKSFAIEQGVELCRSVILKEKE